MNKLPSFKDLISIEKPIVVRMSPQGDKIAYTLRYPNWKENRYEQACYVYFVNKEKSFRVTKINSDTTNLRWFDNDSLAVLQKDFSDDKSKTQIFLYQSLIGDAFQVTESETDILSFECFLDGFLYTTNKELDSRQTVHDELGDFSHIEEEKSKNALFYTNLQSILNYKKEINSFIKVKNSKKPQPTFPAVELTQLLPDRYTIERILVSNNKNRFFLNCRLKDEMLYLLDKLTFIIDGDVTECLSNFVAIKSKVDDSSKDQKENNEKNKYIQDLQLKPLKLPAGSQIGAIDSKGKKILIDMNEKGENYFYSLKDIWMLDLEVVNFDDEKDIIEKLKLVSKDIRREVFKAIWIENDIFFHYPDHCDFTVNKVKSDTFQLDKIEFDKHFELLDFDTTSTNQIVFIGSDLESSLNVFYSKKENQSWKTVNISQIQSFDENLLGSTEQITWKSRDGTSIEGVLRKPANFDPTKKYPLVLVVHGGPTWISSLVPFDYQDTYYYPTLHFINNDILVLKPNYRGSIGRGADFLQLNKDNLGVGDLWDIESGVEHLVKLGYVDSDRVGCMGWSQGGYISAFATVNSSMFKAISVGAGISDWYTYYVSTDIRQFTVHYLSGSPLKNRDAYLKTSPMTNINKAKTPTLIQHGSSDARVPYSNANELFRALKDMGVPVELFSFTAMPHGITKPKENRAVVIQNFTWFSHYLLDKELNFFKDN